MLVTPICNHPPSRPCHFVTIILPTLAMSLFDTPKLDLYERLVIDAISKSYAVLEIKIL